MSEYTLTQVVAYFCSSCDRISVMPGYTLTNLTLTQPLLFHVTVYLFRTLLYIWLYI